jgi:hypothetical protein
MERLGDVGRRAQGDRHEHRQAECPAHLPRGLDGSAREPRLVLVDAGEGRDLHGDLREPEPDADDRVRREDVDQVVGVGRHAREQEPAGALHRHADRERRRRAQPRDHADATRAETPSDSTAIGIVLDPAASGV